MVGLRHRFVFIRRRLILHVGFDQNMKRWKLLAVSIPGNQSGNVPFIVNLLPPMAGAGDEVTVYFIPI